MRREYKTVRVDTVEGIKAAERLYANGWKQERVGLFSIMFAREVKPRTKRVN